MKTYAIVLAAGKGLRAGLKQNKMFAQLAGRTPLEYSLKACKKAGCFDGVVIVCQACEMDKAREIGKRIFPDAIYVEGGATRQQSAYAGLKALPEEAEIAAIHDGARCFITPELIVRCVQSCEVYGSGVAGRRCTDTVKTIDAEDCFVRTLNRDEIILVETPQVFLKEDITKAYEQAFAEGYTGTDDAGLMERMGRKVRLVESREENFKLTIPHDFIRGERRLMESRLMHVGQGYDIHALVPGRKLILGGIEIPYAKGLLGHSDADALIHALIDAMLGAAALGDIGELFPDTDPAYHDADSMLLLEQVREMLEEKFWAVMNIDATLFLEQPKMSPYKESIRKNIAEALGLSLEQVNIKAKTAEKFGAVGKGEAIAAAVTCALRKR